MTFVLGTIFGIFLAAFLLYLEVYLSSRGGFLISRMVQKAEDKLRPKGAVIEPLTDIEDILNKADEEGEDIKIEEL